MPKENYRKYLTPEAIRKHKAYVMTYIDCPACSHKTMRCNMTKHRKSKKHITWLAEHPDYVPEPRKKKQTIPELTAKLEDALKKLDDLETILKR